MITIDDFQKVEIKIGEIKSAEKVEGSSKLLKLTVDFGEKESVASGETGEMAEADRPRQIISGISTYFPDEKNLIGKLKLKSDQGFKKQWIILKILFKSINKKFWVKMKITTD